MKFTHVVFDIDGTLLDTEEMVLNSLSETLRRFCGRAVSPEKLTFALGIPGEDALRRLQVESPGEICKKWNTAAKEYDESIRVFPGIRGILNWLRDQEICLGVITSRTKTEYERGFVPFGLAEFFPIAVCADDAPRHKPYADPMEAYLRTSGANRREVLYVGDSRYDMECARAAGVPCALALWGCKNPGEIVSDYRFRRPEDIQAVLETGKNQCCGNQREK